MVCFLNRIFFAPIAISTNASCVGLQIEQRQNLCFLYRYKKNWGEGGMGPLLIMQSCFLNFSNPFLVLF